MLKKNNLIKKKISFLKIINKFSSKINKRIVLFI
jgi:hypothetical protein